MTARLLCLLLLSAPAALGQMSASMPMHGPAASDERLGSVDFPVSCKPATQAAFNRGVALLHDFWYAEAGPQFQRIAKNEPKCAMAHWGLAMSSFHQIWDRPDAGTMKLGAEEIGKAKALGAKTPRERAYIDALDTFFRPGPADYPARITAYSTAMERVSKQYPDDLDAGAFYALSLLAAQAPDDASVAQPEKAMAVLRPLFAKYPDNPGVVHYIIHACDNPHMAQQGLQAADHYGEIAPAGAHAVHMSGHIYARLGMWPQDIRSQLAGIAASEAAEARHESGIMDEPHAHDFLSYAYMQSGDDAKARETVAKMPAVLARIDAMPGMGAGYMDGMVAYYQEKLPVFYALEMRDWESAAKLEPAPHAPAEQETLTWWARAIADGHLHHAEQAKADLARYDVLMTEVKRGRHAFIADSTGSQIERNEMAAWANFAEGNSADALTKMRKAADLQDKVGQGEVDIPAREMLGDLLLELKQPAQALAEYRVALQLSPNRFNGLYHAGMAAEQAGDAKAASGYYDALLKNTAEVTSTRPELAHAREFISSVQQAKR